MNEDQSRKNYLVGSKTFRWLQVIPGMVTLLIIFSPVWGSLLGFTQLVLYYIAFVTIFWVYRAFTMSVGTVIAYRRYLYEIKVDYQKKIRQLIFSTLPDQDLLPTKIDKFYVSIIIPIYKEPLSLLEKTLQAISDYDYPYKDNLMIILAIEERGGEKTSNNAKFLINKYQKHFKKIFCFKHPAFLPNEVQGIAGSNLSWAAKKFSLELDKMNIDAKHVFMIKHDSDLIGHPKLLSALVYKYLTTPHRYKRFFAPALLLYSNNYWQVPILMRQFVASLSLGILNVWVTERRWQECFSCYSFNFHLLKSFGYWNPQIGVDDTGFYYDAFFHLKGDFEGIPVFIPGYSDAVETHRGQYQQLLRWGWGAILYPATLQVIIQRQRLSLLASFWRILRLFYVYNFMRTTIVLLNLGVPLLRLLNSNVNFYAQAHILPQLGSIILTIAWIFIIPPRIVLEKLYGHPPKSKGRLFFFWHYIEQVVIIIHMFTYFLIPDLHAQLEMMFGKGKKVHYVAEKSER